MTIIYLAVGGLGLVWSAQIAIAAGAGCYFAFVTRKQKRASRS